MEKFAGYCDIFMLQNIDSENYTRLGQTSFGSTPKYKVSPKFTRQG